MVDFDHIHFDMSRNGLVELSSILEPLFTSSSDELKNFTNEIRGMVQRAPAVKENAWLDE